MKQKSLDKITVDTSNDFNIMEGGEVAIKVNYGRRNILLIESDVGGVDRINLRQDLYAMTKERFIQTVSDFLYDQCCCLHKFRYYAPHMLVGEMYLEKPKGIK